MKKLPDGVFPTMITPFDASNRIDEESTATLAKFYADRGCEGIFAVCQSSEQELLSLKERVRIAEITVRTSKERGVTVVASGHVADSLEEQAEEIVAMHTTGVSAVVTVSNRLDIKNEGDTIWLKNAETLLTKIPSDIQLGIYECPKPYKRLLTPEILEWCKKSGRFTFIKDTCCDPAILKDRLRILSGSNIKLFNANAQTLLYSLQHGAAGYSGIMANFHPELYVWLCRNFNQKADKARLLSDFLSLYAFTESLHYPVTAKYRLNLEGVTMSLSTRRFDKSLFNEYDKMVIEQGKELESFIKEMILEEQK